MSTVPMDVQLLWVTLGLPTASRLGGITAGPRASQLLGGPEGEPREESRNPLHSPQGSGGGGAVPRYPSPSEMLMRKVGILALLFLRAGRALGDKLKSQAAHFTDEGK